MPSLPSGENAPFFVTIPAGLSMCLRASLDAKDSEGSMRGIDTITRKCTDNSGVDLALVRRASIESASAPALVKLSKKVLDSSKAVLAMHSIFKMLIAPPPRGVTDVADPLRRSLIESGFGQHCAETLAKYADQGPVVEAAALNLQYVFNNPSMQDAMQPTITSGCVAALAATLIKSGNSEPATAGSLETLAFIAHVDATKRKGEWNVMARLADADAWTSIVNKSLGNHGKSGRVTSAVMLLLYKCASSPKATNFLRALSAAGLVATALRFARRSIETASGAGVGARDRSSSPSRADATMSATKGAASHAGGGAAAASAGAAPMRSYAQHAWSFIGEVAAKAPDTLLGGDPESMVKLLMQPLLSPLPHLLPHAKASLAILASLVKNSPDFLTQFVAHGGCAALAKLIDTLRVPEGRTSLDGADIMLAMSNIPSVLPAVLASGGFEVLVNAYFRAWEMVPASIGNALLRGKAVANAPHSERLEKLRGMALGIVRLSRMDEEDDGERREMLAKIVVGALASGKGDESGRHVRAAANLLAWTLGGEGEHAPTAIDGPELLDGKAYVAAGAVRAAYSAMRVFALQDQVLSAVLAALQVLQLAPAEPEAAARTGSVAPRPGDAPPPPPEAPGAQLIGAVLDVLKTSLKRDAQPDMHVWTVLFVMLEATLARDPANMVAFLKWPGLLGLLSRFLEWSIRVCDAEQYRDWRLETRPPRPDEEHAKKLGDEAKAAALAHGSDAGSAEAEKQAAIDEAMKPTELPDEVPQWVPARFVRLFNFACGDGGSNSGTVAQLRAAALHRKVADFVWPWVLALPNDALEDEEIDAGAVGDFLAICWRVQKDGPYAEVEAGLSREDIALVAKKNPGWQPDAELLTPEGHGWRWAEARV